MSIPSFVDRRLSKHRVRGLQKVGVSFINPSNTYIDEDVEIGPGTIIYPNVYLYRGTRIGSNCRIFPETHVFQSSIGDGCTIWPSVSLLSAVIEDNAIVHRGNRIVYSSIGEECSIESDTIIKWSEISRGCTIGPYANVRENSKIAHGSRVYSSEIINSFIGPGSQIKYSVVDGSHTYAECIIGPHAHIRGHSRIFEHAEIADTEVVRSFVGPHTKAKHGRYIGDAVIGKNCNIGAGTVFCNYDGSKKHETVLGDDVFIGSGTMLIAPVTLEHGSFIAAGSVISQNVPAKALAIGRGQHHTHSDLKKDPENIDSGTTVKEGYVTKDENGWHIQKPR